MVNRGLKFSGDQYGFLYLPFWFFSPFCEQTKTTLLDVPKKPPAVFLPCDLRHEDEPSADLRSVVLERVTTKRAARRDLYLMMTKWCLCLRRTVGADVQVAAKLNKTLAHSHASRLQIDNWTKTESGSIGKTQINRRTIVHSNRHFLRGPNKEEMLRGYDNWRQRQKKKKKGAGWQAFKGWLSSGRLHRSLSFHKAECSI